MREFWELCRSNVRYGLTKYLQSVCFDALNKHPFKGVIFVIRTYCSSVLLAVATLLLLVACVGEAPQIVIPPNFGDVVDTPNQPAEPESPIDSETPNVPESPLPPNPEDIAPPLTRADGRFDMVVNGGGLLTIHGCGNKPSSKWSNSKRSVFSAQ